MPSISLKKKDLPFLFGGTGEAAVDTGNLQPGQPVDGTKPVLLDVHFTAKGSDRVALGLPDTVKLTVSTKDNLQLIAIFPGSTGAAARLAGACGQGDFFKDGRNSEKLLLALDTGISAGVSAAGSFGYSALKTTFEVNAGVDGGYGYVRAFDKALPLQQVLLEFFKSMRLPEQVDGQPAPGEAVSLRFGGYLRVGVEASAGYRLLGTRSTSLGHMALSEKYGLAVLGKVGLSAGIAGQFSVLITAASGLPGWARVQVHREHSADYKVAADVNVGFKSQLDHLPPGADEFLGAVLGVNARNFLNVLQKADELADYEKFKGAVDGLARKYVGEFIGQGFEKLGAEAGFKAFLERVHSVLSSYEKVEDRAVALLDRYFHNVPGLTSFLERIQALQPGMLQTLRNTLDPEPWNMLSQLTDGDPLGFLLEEVIVGGRRLDSLAELKKRAAAALDLIRGDQHSALRDAVAVARLGFGVDWFFRELAKIDTVDELQALANEKVGMFVTRLVGRTLDSAANLKEAFKQVKAVLDQIESFKDKLYKRFKEATRASYQVGMNAAYSRASENDALVDALINVSDRRGVDLLAQAGRGDFEQVLTTSDAGLVRLQKGVFTHQVRLEQSWKVHILGWHLNYEYEGFDRVITETEQRLVPSDQGLTVLTTADLTLERERKRNGEQTHVNFLLRAMGESARAIKTQSDDTAYFIEALESATARYRLSFTDENTSAAELRDYLAFAADVQLDTQGATLEALIPFLPQIPNGGYGRIEASYDIRFGARAVSALLSIKELTGAGEAAVRRAMRQMVLSNYLKSEEQHDVAFAYATPGVFDIFAREGFAEFGNHSRRVFAVNLPNSGISAPSQVALERMELAVLITLYNIENSMVRAIRELYELLNSGKPLDPRDFENRLAHFGSAMKSFDEFDQTTNRQGCGTTTVFAMFDALVRLAAGGGTPVSTASLRLTSEANGRTVEKIFLSPQAADALVTTVQAVSA
jgi:hypothetical protein